MSRNTKITDEEERELIESSEHGEWVSVGNIEEQRAFWQKVARDTLAGDPAAAGEDLQQVHDASGRIGRDLNAGKHVQPPALAKPRQSRACS